MPPAASPSTVSRARRRDSREGLWFNQTVVTPAPAVEQAIARGSEQLKAGKLSEAQQLFRAALEGDPTNARVLALLGLTYFRGNQFGEARPIYEDLVDKAPTDASHRLNLGLVYLKLNEADKAISSLEASRALDPSQGRAVSYLGLAYARAGRYAEAYRSFLLAGQNELASEIELNLTAPERDGIHNQLGRTPQGPLPDPSRTATPPPQPAVARTMTPQPAVARTATPQLAVSRTATPPPAIPGTVTPQPAIPGTIRTQPAIARAATPEPRTRPPTAPPRARTKSPEEIAAADAFAAQLTNPEIVIEKLTKDSPQLTTTPVRSGASVTEASQQPLRVPESQPSATDSMQFVLPRELAVPQPVDGQSMISLAVEAAVPASATTSATPRTASGGIPPRPLSELATDELIRPTEGTDPFEITATGALIIRVVDRVLTRLDGVHITGGDLTYELAMRRSRGHQTAERFDYGGTPLHSVSGHGYLISVPPAGSKHVFSAVMLDDDILYLREDLVFAFESSLRWESGNVPGLRGKLPIVQFRGDGALTVRLERPLVRIKLPAQGVVFVDADRLVGWIGRVIPRAVVPPNDGPMGAMCVECTGEGIVLVEPAAEGARPVTYVARARPPARPASEKVEPPNRPADEPPDDPPAATAPEAPVDEPPESAIDALDRLDEI
jgi:Flp pilus assembly protein TadD/uncharacterized protein (AIM24 family)